MLGPPRDRNSIAGILKNRQVARGVNGLSDVVEAMITSPRYHPLWSPISGPSRPWTELGWRPETVQGRPARRNITW